MQGDGKEGVCNKRIVRCADCKHRRLHPLDNWAAERHLRGKDEKCRDVIGLFPLLEDDMCYLLAMDFDKKEWQKDVAAFRETCTEQGIEVAVERSRSGNGAHVWMFFSERVQAKSARTLGSLLLTHAMNKRHQIGFESYDRLFPNQDTMPKGGFGNLIALPLQGKARKEGNSVFINEQFVPYTDQWQYISGLKQLTNPDFFRAQAMRLPTYNKPRIIYGFDETEQVLALPRGCEEKLLEMFKQQGVKVVLREQRNMGKDIDVIFNGELRDEQIPATDEMLKYENGILAATTAFGKTVIGAYLIAARKVNTLIIVHNKQLLEQWKERLQQFLVINEVIPEEFLNKRGRKPKGIIGEIGGGKKRAYGIIDVAIIQSLTKKEEMRELIKTYGMVIVDECHHISAFSFEQVIRDARAKYVYGLTATPTRQDGHHPIIFMQCGPIRYLVDAKQQAKERAFEHYLIPRFTSFKMPIKTANEKYGINAIYKELCENELRNIV